MDRELFKHEERCWTEGMTFSISEHVFFNDLPPSEPV